MVLLTSKNGNKLPELGLGTFKLSSESFCEAIKIGYRIIDTSDDYGNESLIGMLLDYLYDNRIVTREDLFIQTKISDDQSFWDEPLRGVYFWKSSPFMSRHNMEEVMREKLRQSKRRLKTNYLDSVLLHFPYPDYYVEMWHILCKIQKEENIRYIGVSNFGEYHIKSLGSSDKLPQINQNYFSPIGSRQRLCDYCNNHGIKLMTYSPLMDYHNGLLNNSIIKKISEKYEKLPSQIILRWNIERGSIPFPKSNHPDRLASNIESLQFRLEKDDVELLSLLNCDYQYIPISRYCPGIYV